MNPAALRADQHRWDYMEPPEDDDECVSEPLARARRACDAIEAASRGRKKRTDVIARSVADAISALQDIPTQEPI